MNPPFEEPDYAQVVANDAGLAAPRVAAIISLLDEGCTVPFIARYRKEATGGLDEDQLRKASDLLDTLRSLAEKK